MKTNNNRRREVIFLCCFLICQDQDLLSAYGEMLPILTASSQSIKACHSSSSQATVLLQVRKPFILAVHVHFNGSITRGRLDNNRHYTVSKNVQNMELCLLCCFIIQVNFGTVACIWFWFVLVAWMLYFLTFVRSVWLTPTIIVNFPWVLWICLSL
jgi:hypothetical protein